MAAEVESERQPPWVPKYRQAACTVRFGLSLKVGAALQHRAAAGTQSKAFLLGPWAWCWLMGIYTEAHLGAQLH